MKCYIAGPMTGRPGFNYQAFDEARDTLKAEGWSVISPADLDRENHGIDFAAMEGTEDLSEYVTDFARQDMDALLKVDTVFVLPEWETSTGAKSELTMASMLGLPILDFTTGGSVEWEASFSHAPKLPATSSERRGMLDEAASLVDGDRNAQYGDPRQDFRRTAELWTTYLDGKSEIGMQDVAAMMGLLKLSRIRWSPEKRDSWVDLAGYAACGWDCARPEESTEE